MIVPVTTDRTVRLAAMECAASCLMTALFMSGRNPDLLLLDYWSLSYTSETLVAGKHVRLLQLDYLYGIRHEISGGSEKDLKEALAAGSMLLLLCRAGRLRFFPQEMLTHEDAGFQHMILIYGYDSVTARYDAADPIAGYVGTMTAREIVTAGEQKERLYYYRLSFPDVPFREPEPRDLFRTLAERNRQLFVLADIQGGTKAIECFSEDLTRVRVWPAFKRESWIFRNNITIAAIAKLRPMVWKSFVALDVLNDKLAEEGDRRLERVVRLWMSVNLSLVKLKTRFEDEAFTEALLWKLHETGRAETEFLNWLCESGRQP